MPSNAGRAKENEVWQAMSNGFHAVNAGSNPAGDANIFNGLHSALVTGLLCTHSGVHKMPLEIPPQGALFL